MNFYITSQFFWNKFYYLSFIAFIKKHLYVISLRSVWILSVTILNDESLR